MPNKRRQRRPYKPLLTIDQILAWADEHYRRYRGWPYASAGRIVGASNETWAGVAFALCRGTRGLNRRITLAQLLRRKRGVLCRRSALTEATIFQWQEAHHSRTGARPKPTGGTIPDAPAETWTAINAALKIGHRGLPPGSSLYKVLAKHGVQRIPPFSPDQVLAWAEAFFAISGRWPHPNSWPISEAPSLTWRSVDRALRSGPRGLNCDSSLSHFLNKHRGIFQGMKTRPHVTNGKRQLTMEKLCAWSKAYRRRTGSWPRSKSDVIHHSGGMTWAALDAALCVRRRGLVGGSSLARLFTLRPR
jgi:hypothetical protein